MKPFAHGYSIVSALFSKRVSILSPIELSWYLCWKLIDQKCVLESIMFNLNIYISPYNSIIFFWLSLYSKFWNEISPTFFFFFILGLISQRLLPFYMYFKTSLLICEIYCWNFNRGHVVFIENWLFNNFVFQSMNMEYLPLYLALLQFF